MINKITAVLAGTVLCLAAGAGAAERMITVAADGSGQFTSVQAAVDSVPVNNPERVVIHIKPGTYKERITVPQDKPFITFRGQDPNTTILTYNWTAYTKDPNAPDPNKNVGTGGSSSTFIFGHDFVAENVTFQNSAGRAGQAVALKSQADRLVFRNCRFLGWQDTLYADAGRQYFTQCTIEGHVDFIFGAARAYFEECTIHSREGGYVTAQSRLQPDADSGYVFHKCRLIGDGSTYLGRPWRPYALVVYDRCWMDSHIRPEGWNNWRKVENEKTAYFAEYQSTGPGANPSARVKWSHQLTDEQAKAFRRENFLKGQDNWDPTAQTATQPVKPTAAAVKPGWKVVNNVCPIMGTKIDPAKVPDSLIRDYKGQKVGFCCSDCPKDWDSLSDAQKDAKLQAVLPKP
jgi:pectinesterase